MSLHETIINFSNQHQLFDGANRCLIAVSGGPDSTAALLLLRDMVTTGKLDLNLAAGHIVHDLREEGPEEDRKFVKNLCDIHDIPFYSKKVFVRETIRQESRSPEAVAREARYRALGKICKEIQSDILVTAHHRDDQIETLILRLMRGTGLEGLTGIQPRRPMIRGREDKAIQLVRPLLNISKNDLVAYLKNNKITWREDPSNKNTSYRRNFVRHLLLPHFRKNVSQTIDQTLLEIRNRAQDVHNRIETLWEKRKPNINKINKRLQILRDSVQNLVPIFFPFLLKRIRMELNMENIRPSFNDLQRLKSLLKSDQTGRKETLSGGLLIGYDHKFLIAERQGKTQHNYSRNSNLIEKTKLPVPGQATWENIRITISEVKVNDVKSTLEESRKNSRITVLDKKQVTLPLTVGPRTSGDRIQPLGMEGTKSLKDLFIDEKIPESQRATWPVIRDQKGPIWIPGLCMSERVKVRTEDINSNSQFLMISTGELPVSEE